MVHVKAQTQDIKSLNVSYYLPGNSEFITLKSLNEYDEFIQSEGYSSNDIKIDFEKYFLIGFQGTDKCEPSNYESAFSVRRDSIIIDLFINEGYCLNLVIFNKWFLVNRKHIDKVVKVEVHEILDQLEEIQTDCYFHTDFQEKTLLIESQEQYQRIFSESDKPCVSIDFTKYSLLAEYAGMGGCGFPSMIKTIARENDSLIIHSRITQIGLCKRMNRLYTTHLIEKKLLSKFKHVVFRKNINVIY